MGNIPFPQGKEHGNICDCGEGKRRAQQPNFDHLGTSSGEKDAVCAKARNFKVQKIPSKDPRLPCSRETEVPVAQWTGPK